MDVEEVFSNEMKSMLVKVGWKKEFIEKCTPYLPISGWMGDNLLKKSTNMDWWKGMDVEVGKEIVTHPAGDGQIRGALLNELLLPANFYQHALHLVGDLLIPALLVPSGVAVHLVHATADLLHAQQIDEPGMLPGLALDLTGLVVALGNGSCEISICGDHDERNICLGCTGDHVLDEIAVTRCINDGVMPFVGVELFGGARNGHTALALLLLPVHVEGKCEGTLAKTLSLLLQLIQLTLGQLAQLKNEPACRRALTTVDMATDHNGQVLLVGVGERHCKDTRACKPQHV